MEILNQNQIALDENEADHLMNRLSIYSFPVNFLLDSILQQIPWGRIF